MKKAKIILIISLLVFISLLLVFIFTKPQGGKEKATSALEQYQKEYNENTKEGN